MSDEKALIKVHPEGEPETGEIEPPATPLSLDTFAGKIQFRWVPDAEVSSLGQMPFFIEFLKTGGLFENWVNDCPLQYTSTNCEGGLGAGLGSNGIRSAGQSRLRVLARR
jgi:hypothetical protein